MNRPEGIDNAWSIANFTWRTGRGDQFAKEECDRANAERLYALHLEAELEKLRTQPAKAEPGLSEARVREIANEVASQRIDAVQRLKLCLSDDGKNRLVVSRGEWGPSEDLTVDQVIRAANLHLSMVESEVALTLSRADIGSVRCADILRAGIGGGT